MYEADTKAEDHTQHSVDPHHRRRFSPGIRDLMKAGDVAMIQNDHTKSFATVFTELAAYPDTDEERQSWQQGMVTGNGENGAVCAGSPYNDTLIYQNIRFLMPTNDPRYTPDEVTAELEEALPALPKEWTAGSIRGLRARTNAQVDLQWTADSVTVTVTSDTAQTIKVGVSGGEAESAAFAEGET